MEKNINKLNCFASKYDKLLRYIAAGIALAIFLLSLGSRGSIISLYSMSMSNMIFYLLDSFTDFPVRYPNFIISFFNILAAIALLTLSIGLFLDKNKGVFIALAVSCGAEFLLLICRLFVFPGSVYTFFAAWSCAFFLLLLLSFIFKGKKSLYLGLCAGITILTGTALKYYFIASGTILTSAPRSGRLLWTVIGAIAYTILAVAFGLIYSQQNPVERPLPQKSVKPETTTESRIESLTNLKELLDTGIITQEEFDAKKQQILEL